MHREISAGVAALTVDASLDVLRVDGDLYAYSLTRSVAASRSRGDFIPHVPLASTGIEDEQGFTDAAGLADIRAGRPARRLALGVASASCLAAMTDVGVLSAMVDGPGGIRGLERDRVHDALLADPPSAARIVGLDTGSWLLTDRTGNPLRVAIAFGPGLGHRPFDEGTYDIDRLAEALDARDDVKVYPLHGSGDVDYLGTAASAAEGIHVPYGEDRGTRTIAFRWMPSPGDHAAAWDEAYRLAGTRDPAEASLRLQRAVIDLDLMDLSDCLVDRPAGPAPR